MKMLLIVLFFVLVSQHTSGVEVVEKEEGVKSVLLPCQVPADVTRDFSIMLWGREELRKPTVHMRLQSGEDLLSGQNPRYTDRTSMRANALWTGDFSLTLSNPTVSDSGTYSCIIKKDLEDLSRTDVQLKVTEPRPVWAKVLIPVGVPVLVLLAGIWFLMYRVKERQKKTAVGQLTAEEVREGAQSVQLPYKTKLVLGDIVKVKWILVKKEDINVFVFKDGDIHPEKQHEDYKERAEMNTEQLKDKGANQLNEPIDVDFTLMLKKPKLSDGGVFICSIYHKDRETMLEQKVVPLVVKEPLWNTIKAALGFHIKEVPNTQSESHQEVCAEETHPLNDQPV